MAVKQNNTEANEGTTPGAKGAPGNSGNANPIKSDEGSGGAGVGGGGGGGGSGENEGHHSSEMIGLPLNEASAGANALSNGIMSGASMGGDQEVKYGIKGLLKVIQSIDDNDNIKKLSHKEMALLYEHIIWDLARIQVRNTADDVKLFKEDIVKVGAFLARPNEKGYLMFYLRIVYELITQSEGEPPSCAVAIVFHLFNPNMIIEAVQSLLDQNVLDSAIKKTVSLLCDWIRICNFCQNLNLWIMAILTGLRDQEKFLLLDEISLENIDKLFFSINMPAMRPKIAPLVFHMLTTINQTPAVFHKILPKIPTVLRCLKQQSQSNMNEMGSEARVILQKLVDVCNALMLRFFESEELFEPVKAALQMYEPSYNYYALARAMHENAMPMGRRNARVGLVNLGNTCYMNSVLQALAMTSDFSRQILLIESSSPLLLKVQQQIALMHHSLRYELTPSRVLSATRPPGFTPGLQQDSSEFLGYLLDLLHEHEINTSQHKLIENALVLPGMTGVGRVLGGSGQAVQKMDIDAGEASNPASLVAHAAAASEGVVGELSDEIAASGVIPYNSKDHELSGSGSSQTVATNTPTKGKDVSTTTALPAAPTTTPTTTPTKKSPSTIDKTFAGKLFTTYKCLDCAWESHNEDTFRELQLSFPDDKDECSATNYSVQDLIEYYCSAEKLDGDNQYFCPRCKKLCDAERRIGITQAPRNLILTLKQFKYDQKYHFRTKLMHKVFHDESVTIKVCSTDSLQELSTVHYDLYAGVVHAGYSMDSGHYFTFASDQSKNWYKFNDSLVTSSQLEEMHNLTSPNTPYILFYQMCGHSNESAGLATANSAVNMMVSVPLPQPLTLEELPRQLRDYVKQDNRVYHDELKLQRFKRNAKRNNERSYGTITRNGYEGDDDDDQSPPPTGGCGGNDLGMNMNRFVY